MERRWVLSGIGGQGVVFATKVLSQAALLRGLPVMASENHGMSQRGGSVMSHVKIGAGAAPLIRRGTADALLALDRVEALRNLAFVRGGGQVFVNSAAGLEPAIEARLQEMDVGLHAVDATLIAREIGAPAAVNLIVLGFAAAHADFGLTLDDLKQAVQSLGPARLLPANLQALEQGAARAGLSAAEAKA